MLLPGLLLDILVALEHLVDGRTERNFLDSKRFSILSYTELINNDQSRSIEQSVKKLLEFKLQLLVETTILRFEFRREDVEDLEKPVDGHRRARVNEAFEEFHHVDVHSLELLLVICNFNEVVGLFACLEVGLEVEVNAVEQIAVHELAVERLSHCLVLLVFVKRLVARLLNNVPLLINHILLNRLDHLVWRDTYRE